MHYKPNHFGIYEFVPRDVYHRFGDGALQFLRPVMLMTLDAIRERYGRPVTSNNWFWGGEFQYRGFRPCNCNVGAELSMHRLGGACDFDVEGMTAAEVRADILGNPNAPAFQWIKCIEMNVNWVHIDFRNIDDRIRKVFP